MSATPTEGDERGSEEEDEGVTEEEVAFIDLTPAQERAAWEKTVREMNASSHSRRMEDE
jgi:hypothetical protein